MIGNTNSGSEHTLALDNATLNCKRIAGLSDYLGIYWLAKNVSLKNKSALSIEDEDGESAYYNGAGFNGNLNLTLDNTSLIILKRAALNNNANVKSQFSKYLPSGYTLVESSNIDESKPLVVSHNNGEYYDTVILSAKTDANVSKDVKAPVTTSDSNGSHTKRVTVFGKNVGSGTKIFASADTVEKNSSLVIPVSVDVNILNESWIQAVSGGSVALSVSAPEWLKISGSSSAALDGKTKTFVLSGTPTSTAEKQNVSITANVTLTGDTELTASCDKSVSVTITEPPVTFKSLDVKFTSAPATLTVMQGGTQTAQFTAKATASYSDNLTKEITAITYSLDKDYSWIKIGSDGTVTAAPTADYATGNTSVKVIATATADNGTPQTATAELTVTVTQKYTPVPTSLTFDKAAITMNLESGDSRSESVTVTVKDQNGNDMTAKGEIVAEKTGTVTEWIDFGVEGNKITFTAAPGAGDKNATQLFSVAFKYDGKEYLKTNYRVVVNVTEVSGYALTVSASELTVYPGSMVSADFNGWVKFERVFKNGNSETIDGAILFSHNGIRDEPWMAFDENSGVLTLNPGEDVKTGTYHFALIVTASYKGKEVAEEYRSLY